MNCSLPRCDHPVKARGLCNRHYLAWKKYGDPEGGRTNRTGTLRERLDSALIERESGCIEWVGASIKDGYGTMHWQGRVHLTHRLAWEDANRAPVPDGLHVLHRCDNPPCCNPAHLFLGTDKTNALDKCAKGRAAQKVTPEMVVEIRSAVAAGASGRSVARRLSLSVSAVCDIARGKAWAHIPMQAFLDELTARPT